MKNPTQKPLPKKAKSNPTSAPTTDPAIAFLDPDEMIEFMNAKAAAEEAAERGDAEVPMPAALMHKMFAVTQPMDLDHLRTRFNRLCEELGKPEEKVPDPAPIEYGEGEGPF